MSLLLFDSKKFNNEYSILFDGVNEAINIDSTKTSLATTTTGTWSVWMKVADATPATAGVIVSFGDTDANNHIELFITTTGLFQGFARNAAEVKWDVDTDSAAFTDNKWAHVAIVQDGVSPVLYVNGVAVAQTFTTQTNKAWWLNSDSNIDNGRIACLNRNSAGNTNFINGNIDEVSIWNINLTASQIAAIYNNGKPNNLKKHSAFSNLVMWIRGDGAVYNGTNLIFPNSSENNSNTGTSINMEASDINNNVP